MSIRYESFLISPACCAFPDVPRSNTGTQLLGHALFDVGLVTYAHSGEDATLESKKRALKVLSAMHAGCAAHFVYRVQQKESPLAAGLSTAAGMAILSGLCAWKGFSDDKKEDEDSDTKKKK